jgi:hypothetical protein
MTAERGGYAPPEARRNGRSIAEIKGDAALTELMNVRDAVERNRELLSLAKTDVARGSDRSPEFNASKGTVEAYAKLLERGETPQQIMESAERNFGLAEQALAGLEVKLRDVPAYQELQDAERREREEISSREAARWSASSDITPPAEPVIKAKRPFGNVRMISREEILKGLSAEEKKLLGMDDKAA